ncbi:hypothetical protein A2382_02160 [Candidatus Woesebacteria bacterium RIFOXYB1_FULL_38_16]|uniref:Metallo-beta-lactamase domain-containing protein n=1 Tax=Candidatus Woesebacteria bacterium RIFOXYB1_FULL_38_16 TaxID=1802538 RepID=A0A1F8CTU4_9BACT|nr:MAG: hypothetical protein A2191_02555 [Candidatus Woesebacteria bacterium RIFOXYA1_FULL_38_9]OGM79701.1 MAG: hypothetical protein A2382_02160 [Candidatus Woesebacteria bacterium RIFOXYB1_FULL_38_16]
MTTYWKICISFLALSATTIWFGVFSMPDQLLHLVTCNVGQGDATLIQQGTTQILIDGGPDEKVLNCLSNNLPFWDKTIELVVLSHPQKDHFNGLINVFENYQVKYFIASSLESSTQGYQVLKKLVGGSGTVVINPNIGKQYRLGLVVLDILAPFTSIPNTNTLGTFVSNEDPNAFSVVLNLKLGSFSALFPGDLDPESFDILSLLGKTPKVEYIKIPHHGSKNGLTKGFLEKVNPKVATISVGKDNSFGHPHKEILDLLKKKQIIILRTDEQGDIEIITNGKKWWLKS